MTRDERIEKIDNLLEELQGHGYYINSLDSKMYDIDKRLDECIDALEDILNT